MNAPLCIMTLDGPDAASFLQGYVTCEMDELQETRALPMGFTDLRGRVICNGWVYGSAAHVSVVMHESVADDLREHLSKYLLFSKAKFEDSVQSASVTLNSRSDGIRLTPFDWGLAIDETQTLDLGKAMIEGRFPIIEQDTTAMFLPQMIGLTDAQGVSFTKGCYLGQEVVARAQHRGQVKRKLRLFDWVGDQLNVGENVKGTESGRGVVVAVHEAQALAVVSGEPKEMDATSAKLTENSAAA